MRSVWAGSLATEVYMHHLLLMLALGADPAPKAAPAKTYPNSDLPVLVEAEPDAGAKLDTREGFQGAKWGMSVDEVLAALPAESSLADIDLTVKGRFQMDTGGSGTGPASLGYFRVKIGDTPVAAKAFFVEGVLAGFDVFTERDDDQSMVLYDRWSAAASEKYGKGQDKSTGHPGAGSKRGMSIRAGLGTVGRAWKTKQSSIMLGTEHGQEGVTVFLEYRSVELWPKYEKALAAKKAAAEKEAQEKAKGGL